VNSPRIGVVSLFPEAFEFLQNKEKSGLIGRAFLDSKVEFFTTDLRQFGEGKHKVVDDMPFGGGDGMVLKPGPLKAAIDDLISKMNSTRENTKVVFMSPAGDLWNQSTAERWALDLREQSTSLILVCGRYAGFDQRLVEYFGGNEVSLGPFILNGGELPALCVIESLVRILPGVLGNAESALKDSFSVGSEGRVEAPSFTRPQDWEGVQVPEVLTAGNHKAVEAFRNQASIERTKRWVEKAQKAISPNGQDTEK